MRAVEGEVIASVRKTEAGNVSEGSGSDCRATSSVRLVVHDEIGAGEVERAAPNLKMKEMSNEMRDWD